MYMLISYTYRSHFVILNLALHMVTIIAVIIATLSIQIVDLCTGLNLFIDEGKTELTHRK